VIIRAKYEPGKENRGAFNYFESWRERVVERSCGASGKYEDGAHWITQNTLSLRSAENVCISTKNKRISSSPKKERLPFCDEI
jgi:hypothetical protein